jgi:dienelactone hydrolase
VWGSERAGDVLVTLDFLRREHAALADRVVLLGWSHGGWAVMDAIAYGGAGRRTPNLKRLPDAPLAGVRAVAAFYPYCGFGTSALRFGWPEGLTALLLVGKRDTNIDPDRCLEVVERLRQEGADFESVVYDADHWFDNPDGREQVPHVYDDLATGDARRRVSGLLRAAAGSPAR